MPKLLLALLVAASVACAPTPTPQGPNDSLLTYRVLFENSNFDATHLYVLCDGRYLGQFTPLSKGIRYVRNFRSRGECLELSFVARFTGRDAVPLFEPFYAAPGSVIEVYLGEHIRRGSRSGTYYKIRRGWST